MEETNRNRLTVIYQPITALKVNPRNSMVHNKLQIRKIAKSIEAFGFNNPVLLDESNTIIAGHGRVAAAKLLSIGEIPTIRLCDLTPDQVRAYVIADNRLAQLAGWDNSILAIELQHLSEIAVDFDITDLGFETPEIDLLLTPEIDGPDPDDSFEVEATAEAVTRVGDLWRLGRHQVLCSDATDKDSYSKLLGKGKAAEVFIDPPYNLSICRHVSGNGSIKHREFPMASGEMSEEQFTSFLTRSLQLLASYSATGSVHYVCMDFRHISELLAAGKQVYDSLLNICCWVKNVGGMGSFYRSRYEFVFVFRNGGINHRNNIQLGKFGRNRTNVWEYPSINTTSKSGDEGNLLALHPTCKPCRLVADALLDCSARGDLVLDTFLGSGTTLIAAERTGRICRGMELDPLYVDTAIRRWQRHTGDFATLVATGKRFDDVAAEISGESHE